MGNIFSKNLGEKDVNSKFVGAFLPYSLNSYLAMYSIATDEPKTGVICNCLKNWQEEMKENLSVEELIELIVKKAMKSYEIEFKKKTFRLAGFIVQIKRALEKKGIEQKYIDEILKRVKDEAY